MGEVKFGNISQYYNLLSSLGEQLLHNQFPNDFEVYMCAFELVADGKTIDYFTFPIMPNAIREIEGSYTNIKKTFGGITIISNDSFIPRTITLTGTFGTNFKFLIGRKEGIDASAIYFSNRKRTFSNQLKTGYGCVKLLENILQMSDKIDKSGAPIELYFYNLAFGTSYLVQVKNKEFSQAMDSNKMWNYNIQLDAIAYLDGIRNIKDVKKNLLKQVGLQFLNKGMSSLTGELKSSIRNLKQKKIGAI